MTNINHKIGLILNDDTPETPLKKRVGLFILFLILVSSFEVILESVVSLNLKYHHHFFIIDAAVSILFSIEYILRLWTYRIDGEKPTVRQRISNITSFYMVIDLVSIIPFYLSLFIPSGYGFIRIVRILRLFRLMKFGRYMKSQNLVVNAIKNKGKELILSMQVVVFLTVILSALLYHIENSAQPNNFGDIIDAFVWSLSKFIGGVGGYGDFEPITFWGQVMATIVGLLGIALFAVPAGIIGAGFVEEIEAIKKDEDLNSIYLTLLKAFNYDMLSGKRGKENINLPDLRRRFISITDIVVKLNLNADDVMQTCSLDNNLRLSKRIKKNSEEQICVEYFENNSSYGTFVNRNSNITIVSPHSCDGFNLGHYTYALAVYLNANYISVEKFGINSLVEETNINFTSNDYYLDSEQDDLIFSDFIRDLKNTTTPGSFVFSIGSSMKNSESFHILNGGKKGEQGLIERGTFIDQKHIESIKNNLESNAKKEDQTVTTHSKYGNNNSNHINWFVNQKLNANSAHIYINPEVLKLLNESYYKSIETLGKSINTGINE